MRRRGSLISGLLLLLTSPLPAWTADLKSNFAAFVYPTATTYALSAADQDSSISSYNSGGTLSVFTPPNISTIPNGWHVRLYPGNGNTVMLRQNTGTNPGDIISVGSVVASVTLAYSTGGYIDVIYDGLGNFQTITVGGGNGGGGSATRTEVTKTSAYTVTPGDVGSDFNNAGAPSGFPFSLPTWASGLNYCFSNVAGQTVTVQAGSGNFIEEVNVQTASGGTIVSTMNYSTVCVVAMTSAIWQIDRHIGGWSLN